MLILVNWKDSKFKQFFHVENPEHQKPMAQSQLWYYTMIAIQSPGPNNSQFFSMLVNRMKIHHTSYINNFGTPGHLINQNQIRLSSSNTMVTWCYMLAGAVQEFYSKDTWILKNKNCVTKSFGYKHILNNIFYIHSWVYW